MRYNLRWQQKEQQRQAYYDQIAHCVNCKIMYPVASSSSSMLCVNCRMEALAWPMKIEVEA